MHTQRKSIGTREDFMQAALTVTDSYQGDVERVFEMDK